MPFNKLHIVEPILRSLKDEGYTKPTPIQEQAIPVLLQGHDLMGCAQTGTGKTAAFAIPILQLLSENRQVGGKRKIRSLILTPTRELAVQIADSFRAYGKYTGLTNTVIFGGVNQGKQTSALNRGIDIVIATPGRLLDLMNQGFVSLRDVEMFVLDEADRMLDMGFLTDVKKIISHLPHKRQTLFFSATMPKEIVRLADTILHDPVKITITPDEPTVDAIKQYVFFVDKAKKKDLLLYVLDDDDIKTALVFTRTKHGADIVVRILGQNNIRAEAIHGNKSQNVRQRALNNFKQQKTRVLVATDIAARGIDVDDLEFVINYEIPNIPETYVHRIGRTGRAGAKGTALSFCDSGELPFLNDIEKLIHKEIPAFTDHPYPMAQEHHEKQPAKGTHGSFHQARPKPSANPGRKKWRGQKKRR